MRLSYQIPLITGLVLILTIMVNLFAFQNIADKRVMLYQKEIALVTSNPDPDKLKAFTELSTLDLKTREDYTAVIDELSTISTALQNISENPELYVSSSSTPNSTSLSIDIGTGKTYPLPLSELLNIKTFGQDTPEGRLVTGIIQELIGVNIVWLICVYIIYMFWVRSIFTPIGNVTENIKKITENAGFTSLTYKKRDEFAPLISAINSLHRSLSIQEKIRSNFLSDLSHEIRTPITAVKCYLEAIEDGVMVLDTKTLLLFKNELDRLASTTEDLLEFERTTHPVQNSINVQKFSLKKILTTLIQEYLPQSQKKGQTILVDMPRETPIRMDENMFIQVIHNIFSNFIKYAGENTTLVCRYQKDSEKISIIFEDNGVGIPEKDLPFVKEKFYRVDTGRTRTDKSMGIGLSIIDHIMRVHEGDFFLENTTPHGLKIILSFPR